MDLSNKNIIPGIHNYCDRWCERCTHTKHCSVFQMEEEAGMMDSNMDSDIDITNQEFWDHLSKVFKDTIKMISEQAEDMGIDLENLEIEKIEVLKHQKGDLEKLSDHYSTNIRDWFQSFYTDSNEEIAPGPFRLGAFGFRVVVNGRQGGSNGGAGSVRLLVGRQVFHSDSSLS